MRHREHEGVCFRKTALLHAGWGEALLPGADAVGVHSDTANKAKVPTSLSINQSVSRDENRHFPQNFLGSTEVSLLRYIPLCTATLQQCKDWNQMQTELHLV